MTISVLALLCSILGVASLFFAWSNRGTVSFMTSHTLWVLVGWCLLLVSLIFWIISSNSEFGPINFVLLVPLIAWTWMSRPLLVYIGQQLKARRENSKPMVNRRPDLRRVAARTGMILLLVPFSAAGAILICTSVVQLLPWDELNQAVLAVLIVPLVWGLLAAWICGDKKLTRPVSVVFFTGLISAGFLFA